MYRVEPPVTYLKFNNLRYDSIPYLTSSDCQVVHNDNDLLFYYK